MADTKISALTALATPASGDLLAIVDISDTTMAATGTDKKITVTNFLGAVAVNIVQGDALNIQTDKVRARDGDGLYLVDDGDKGIFIKDGGCVFIGDTANAGMTVGLTINQGAADNEILALKSSDVGHGMTDLAEADTFAYIVKDDAASGGMRLWGLSAGARAFIFNGVVTTNDTTKSTAGRGVINLFAGKKAAATWNLNDADANLAVITDYNQARFIFDAEGEMHSDAIIGVGDDWDEWDDLALASDLSRLPKAKFNEMMKYRAEDFERAGLLTLSTDEEGNRHAFIRHKALLQFYACCFAEVAQRMERYERALLGLGVNPQLLGAS